MIWSLISSGSNWLSPVEPDFEHWQINRSFTSVKVPEGEAWKIAYEFNQNSTFEGLVRHITEIHEGDYPLLSHDILVTSGDFSDGDKVVATVSDHRFFWYSPRMTNPKGKINLLHTVPLNAEIYQSLSHIKTGQTVRIQGKEILSIEHFDANGTWLGSWYDTGCNTLLVVSVEILP
ncbi:MAG: hypothetical protein WHV66_06105 [Anaerolineales bacterium]